MSSRPSFSLGQALKAAVSSLPAAWGGAWLGLIALWGLTAFGGFVPHHSGFAAGPAALGIMLVAGVVKLMTQGALYRVALFGSHAKTEGLGIGGVQFGRPEWRLLAAGFIVGAFVLMIIAAVFIVFAVAFNSAGMANGYSNTLAAVHGMLLRHKDGDWVFIFYLIGTWVFFVFVALKFSLMQAATIAERRIVALNSFGLSSGNVGKLFVGLIVLIMPLVAVLIAGVYSFLHYGKNHVAALSVMMILHMGLLAVAIFVIMPLVIGFFSSAYRQIVDLRAK